MVFTRYACCRRNHRHPDLRGAGIRRAQLQRQGSIWLMRAHAAAGRWWQVFFQGLAIMMTCTGAILSEDACAMAAAPGLSQIQRTLTPDAADDILASDPVRVAY